MKLKLALLLYVGSQLMPQAFAVKHGDNRGLQSISDNADMCRQLFVGQDRGQCIREAARCSFSFCVLPFASPPSYACCQANEACDPDNGCVCVNDFCPSSGSCCKENERCICGNELCCAFDCCKSVALSEPKCCAENESCDGDGLCECLGPICEGKCCKKGEECTSDGCVCPGPPPSDPETRDCPGVSPPACCPEGERCGDFGCCSLARECPGRGCCPVGTVCNGAAMCI